MRATCWSGAVIAGSVTGLAVGLSAGALAGAALGAVAGYEGPNLLGTFGTLWAGAWYGAYGLAIGACLGALVGGGVGLVASAACVGVRVAAVRPVLGACLGALLGWYGGQAAASLLQPVLQPTARMERHARLKPPEAVRWGATACATLAGLTAGLVVLLARRGACHAPNVPASPPSS